MLEPEEIRNSLRYMTQRLLSLEKANTVGYLAEFKRFIDYMERTDDLTRELARFFHNHPDADPVAWYQRSTRENALAPFPGDRYGRLSLAYQLVFAIAKEKIDVMWLAGNFFDGNNIGEKFHRWKESSVYPFAEELTAMANRKIEGLTDEKGKQDVYAFVYAFLVADPDVKEEKKDERIPAGHPLAAEMSELDLALGRLDRMGLPESDSENLHADVDILHLEISKHRPRKERVLRILGDLSAWDVLAKAANEARAAAQDKL
jgi:hypothetical protein